MVPVSDQDAAIAFYTTTLGFSLVADTPFGEGQRWVEVAPAGGGAALALVPPQGDYQPGRMTGIALVSSDPRADHAELNEKGVDVDEELMGGDGTVPLLFSAITTTTTSWWSKGSRQRPAGSGDRSQTPGPGSSCSLSTSVIWCLRRRRGLTGQGRQFACLADRELAVGLLFTDR